MKRRTKANRLYWDGLVGEYSRDTEKWFPQTDKYKIRTRELAIFRFIQFFQDKTQPDDISSLDVDYYRRNSGLGERSLQSDLECLRGFWNYLIDWKMYPLLNPFARELSSWSKLKLADVSRTSPSAPASNAAAIGLYAVGRKAPKPPSQQSSPQTQSQSPEAPQDL